MAEQVPRQEGQGPTDPRVAEAGRGAAGTWAEVRMPSGQSRQAPRQPGQVGLHAGRRPSWDVEEGEGTGPDGPPTPWGAQESRFGGCTELSLGSSYGVHRDPLEMLHGEGLQGGGQSWGGVHGSREGRGTLLLPRARSCQGTSRLEPGSGPAGSRQSWSPPRGPASVPPRVRPRELTCVGSRGCQLLTPITVPPRRGGREEPGPQVREDSGGQAKQRVWTVIGGAGGGCGVEGGLSGGDRPQGQHQAGHPSSPEERGPRPTGEGRREA